MSDRSPATPGTKTGAQANKSASRDRPKARRAVGLLVLDLLQVRREELGRATLYLLYLLFSVGVFVLGRNVAAALFLSVHGSAALPWMYVASAAAVTLAAWCHSRAGGRMRLDRLIIVSLGVMAALLAGLRVAMFTGAAIVYPMFYVAVEVIGAISVIQFWSLANATHHTREAKRLFGFIGAGGVLASIFGGFGGAALVMLIGTENLIFVMLACIVGSAVLVGMLGRAGRGQIQQALDGSGASTTRRSRVLSQKTLKVFSTKHLRLVAGIVALTFVVTTLVDFQFKSLANQAYEKEALTAFFSLLYGFTGVVALVLQFFVTGRLLERFGVLLALSLLPLFLLMGSAAIFFAPLAIVAAFAKGSDAVFRYSVNDVTMQLLYLPVPPQSRVKAKAFIDGMLKPVAYGLTGLVLALTIAFFPGMEDGVHRLGLVSAVIATIWLFLVTKLRGAYLSSLVDTLHQRRIDLWDGSHRLDDSSAIEVLAAVLESEEDSKVLRALDLLGKVRIRSLDAKAASLLSRHDPRVRLAAVEHLGRSGSLEWADSVGALFEDRDGAVAAAAIEAYCAIAREKSVRAVSCFSRASSPTVRAAAVTGMIRWGGLDGILESSAALEQMVSSPNAVDRRHAAKVLGDAGLPGFYQVLVGLFGDENLSVQREAIASAGRLRSPELIPSLICKLGHPRLGGVAADSLVAYGPGIEDPLAKVLDLETERPLVRLGVPRVLGRLGTQEASMVLTRHLTSSEDALRTWVCRWLNRLHTRFPTLTLDRSRVREAIGAEIRQAYETLAKIEDIGLAEASFAEGGLLASALEDRFTKTLDRVFLLLGMLFHGKTLEAVRCGLDSSIQAVRGNALEVLENSLDRGTKSRLMPLLDERPRPEKIAVGRFFFGISPPAPRDEAVESLIHGPSPWISACALHYLGTNRQAPDQRLGELARDHVSSPVAMVREMAIMVCVRHLPTEVGSCLLVNGRLDDDPGVREYAAALDRALAKTGTEATMAG